MDAFEDGCVHAPSTVLGIMPQASYLGTVKEIKVRAGHPEIGGTTVSLGFELTSEQA